MLSVGLETLKIQPGTKLWITLNFSLRHFDMKGSSRGKAVHEPKHKKEGIISYKYDHCLSIWGECFSLLQLI